MGRGLLDAVPDVQALLELRRRHLRSAGDPLAEGYQGEGRGAAPVSPLDGYRADDPRRLRPEDAGGLSRGKAVSGVGRVDALQLRREPERHDTEEASVLRDAWHAWPLGG